MPIIIIIIIAVIIRQFAEARVSRLHTHSAAVAYIFAVPHTFLWIMSSSFHRGMSCSIVNRTTELTADQVHSLAHRIELLRISLVSSSLFLSHFVSGFFRSFISFTVFRQFKFWYAKMSGGMRAIERHHCRWTQAVLCCLFDVRVFGAWTRTVAAEIDEIRIIIEWNDEKLEYYYLCAPNINFNKMLNNHFRGFCFQPSISPLTRCVTRSVSIDRSTVCLFDAVRTMNYYFALNL